jgi:hypothetical protein
MEPFRLREFSSASRHRAIIGRRISTYCVALAERHDREGILDALRRRHCCGATDDIILDVKSGTHLMGDDFPTITPPSLEIYIRGTKPLAQVDILRDSTVVETLKPGQVEYRGQWTDPKPLSRVHYYYVRVRQLDDELAWGSPMWMDYRP